MLVEWGVGPRAAHGQNNTKKTDGMLDNKGCGWLSV